MFEKSKEDRLYAWIDFRKQIETTDNPIQETIDLYNRAPLVSIAVDPYDDSNWPNPWELLNENQYCDFAIILGIGYTLGLTDRFMDIKKEIHIFTNKKVAQTKYLLYINNNVIGYDRLSAVTPLEVSSDWVIEKTYTLPDYQ